ncbi:MAG: VWA domain-containing protein [Desulfobacterales bacterium]|nr:MAG: VWA domain-containing protein [Desulfobacterales bacterium]
MLASQAPPIAETALDARSAFQLPARRRLYVRSTFGRRDESVISRSRGKYSRAKFLREGASGVALDATLRAAASRVAAHKAEVLKIHPQDLREKVRRHRSPYNIMFVVDNSWSMHVENTLEKIKGIVGELLRDARHHHDQVGMVAFRHNRRPEAAVCLPLTKSYAYAARRLRKIPLSGSTPLPDAIRRAFATLRQALIKYPNALPVMVIITDGLPNIPLQPGGDPYEDIALLGRRLRWEGINTIVVDTEPSGKEAGRSNCRQMAAVSKGKYLPLSRLTRQTIEESLEQIKAAQAVKEPLTHGIQ